MSALGQKRTFRSKPNAILSSDSPLANRQSKGVGSQPFRAGTIRLHRFQRFTLLLGRQSIHLPFSQQFKLNSPLFFRRAFPVLRVLMRVFFSVPFPLFFFPRFAHPIVTPHFTNAVFVASPKGTERNSRYHPKTPPRHPHRSPHALLLKHSPANA